MTELETKVCQLAQLRDAIHTMEGAAKALSAEIATELPQGGTVGNLQVSVSASRRFDEDRALDLLAKAPRETRERCVTTVTREVVDRKALEVLNSEIFAAAWRVGAPVVKLTEAKS